MPQYRPLSQTKFINDANLVAYYPLDGNSTDVKGGYNGTDSNISYTTENFGQIANFVRATPSYITLASAGTSLSFSGDFTISAWVNLAASGGGTLISKATSNGASSNNYELLVGTTGIDLAGVAGKYAHSTATITAGTWYHICVVKTSTGTVAIYLNGQSLSITYPAGAVTYNTNSTQPYIGRRDDGAGNGYWSGKQDDIALLNRALSSSEVNELYQGMTLGEYLGAGSAITKALWHFNDNFTDSSGNGNNLTNSGMVFVDGKFGKGISTAGTTSRYARIASSLGTTDTGDKTIIANIKLNTEFSGADKSDRFCLLGWTSSDTIMSFGYKRVSGVNYLKCEFDRNGMATDEASFAVNLGTTNHEIALTATGRVLKLYLDGKYVAGFTGTSGNGSSNFADFFAILNWNNVVDVTVDETFVEARLWTPQEIAKRYAYQKGHYATL